MDEQQLANSRKMFGTNGIRGVVGKDMSASLALEIGRAVGTVFRGEAVIATDSRTSNVMLKNAIIAGLSSAGMDVVDIGMAPTPSLQYAVAKSEASVGVMITASHNPPEFNGIKVVDSDGTELHFSKELEIEKVYFSKSYKIAEWDAVGSVRADHSANRRYSSAIRKLIDAEKVRKGALNVILDCSNGVAGLVTPDLLREIGVKVKTLNAQPHGSFPGHPSEPTPENLSALRHIVVEEGASFGIAHDGDADRAVFIDEKGNYIPGDKSLALLAGYLVSKNPGSKVVTTVATSDCVADMARKNGGEIVLTRVGSPVVARKMIEVNAILGGEENGGIIYAKHQYCRDAAMATALMCQLVSERGFLSELLEEVPIYHQVKLKIECPDAKKGKVLESLVSASSGKRVDLTDGVKVFEEEGWVIVRPSGTEPLFRIFSQSRSAESARLLASEYLETLGEIIASS